MATQTNVLTEVTRKGPATGGRKYKIGTGSVLAYILMSVLGLLFLFPFFWTVMSSLKTVQELYTFPPTWIPESLQWSNYVKVIQSVPFMLWAYNSVFVVILYTAGTVLSASLVAYSFARFRYRGRDFIFLLTLGT